MISPCMEAVSATAAWAASAFGVEALSSCPEQLAACGCGRQGDGQYGGESKAFHAVTPSL